MIELSFCCIVYLVLIFLYNFCSFYEGNVYIKVSKIGSD